MADIKSISNLPVTSFTADSLPSVVDYDGTYPLSTVHMGLSSRSHGQLGYVRDLAAKLYAGMRCQWPR